MFQNNTFLKRFGRKIKELRERAGLDQSELGKLAGTSRVTVFNIENAKVATNLDVILGLARALNVTPAQLLANDNEALEHPIDECYLRIGERLKVSPKGKPKTGALPGEERRLRIVEAFDVIKEWYQSAPSEERDTFLVSLKKTINHDK
jgi:transcriptional regulator with XRE-family HTH domain